jgi:hypothetical protein
VPDTLAVLGSGLNLAWLAAPWLQERKVAYWGDLDTWGLAMLAIARQNIPRLHALLMDRHTFDTHAAMAVTEPVHAPNVSTHNALRPNEADLAAHLQSLPKGRLEQEFLPQASVSAALQAWVRGG